MDAVMVRTKEPIDPSLIALLRNHGATRKPDYLTTRYISIRKFLLHRLHGMRTQLNAQTAGCEFVDIAVISCASHCQNANLFERIGIFQAKFFDWRLGWMQIRSYKMRSFLPGIGITCELIEQMASYHNYMCRRYNSFYVPSS
jgi:hypothetical protein